ncbi:hypothetical protein [Xanthomonas oryzae]|nr:hypothetical protein [Xanthomonas oryzae]UWI58929.1 hypothetical protein NO430_04275 [Xanthomonas oryzae pv. oryzae]
MNALAVRWNDWPITRKSLAVVTLPLLLLLLAVAFQPARRRRA